MSSKFTIKIAGLLVIFGLILALTPIKITWAGSPNQSIPTMVPETNTPQPVSPSATKAPVVGPSSTPLPPGTTVVPSATSIAPIVTTDTPGATSAATSTISVTVSQDSATVTLSETGGINGTATSSISDTSTITPPVLVGQATAALPAVPSQSQNGSDLTPYFIGLIGLLLVGSIIWLLTRKKK